MKAGNHMYWYTPEGELYTKTCEVEHEIQGHNCCPGLVNTKKVELEVHQWEQSSSETTALSVIPFWEIYNVNGRDKMRLASGKTKSEADFDPDTKMISAAERTRFKQDYERRKIAGK